MAEQLVQATVADLGLHAPFDRMKPDALRFLAARLKVGVTPTVIFLGGAGEIADRLVGYPSRDFYAAYLEESIERASAALRAGRR